jgi:hypothetical protein
MKYITHNEETSLSSMGTGHCGYVYTTYAELVDMFGLPRFITPADHKSSCEWVIIWEDGKRTIIYDSKQCKAYAGVNDPAHEGRGLKEPS